MKRTEHELSPQIRAMRLQRSLLKPFAMILGSFTLLFTSLVSAESRIALVIGNGNYESHPLSNPANDAILMAETLRKVGFDVIEKINADRRSMRRALRDFSHKLTEAGKDSVGLFYYAGHGVQAKGENYMIPVDAQIEDSLDVELEGFPTSAMLSSLAHAGNRLNMVILDACRNNPYKAATRSGGSGLARMDAPSGTLIAYSTAPGKVAADGNRRNSPYTRALARAIEAPGFRVEDVFKSVRVAVIDRTNGEQVPWEASSLTGNFFFVDKTPEPVAPDNTVEITYWNSIKDTNDPNLFESYLQQYPQGLFASLATVKVESLRTQQAAARARQSETAFFQAIQNSENRADFEAYLAEFPNGTFASLAKARITTIVQKEAQQAAQQVTPSTAQSSPNPEPDPDTVFWNQVKDARSQAELQAYLEQFPDGKFSSIAKARISGIEEQRRVAALTLNQPSGTLTFEGPMIGNEHRSDGEGFCRRGTRTAISATVSDNTLSGTIRNKVGRTFAFKSPVNDGRFSARLHFGQWAPYRIEGKVHDGILVGSIKSQGTRCAVFEVAAQG